MPEHEELSGASLLGQVFEGVIRPEVARTAAGSERRARRGAAHLLRRRAAESRRGGPPCGRRLDRARPDVRERASSAAERARISRSGRTLPGAIAITRCPPASVPRPVSLLGSGSLRGPVIRGTLYVFEESLSGRGAFARQGRIDSSHWYCQTLLRRPDGTRDRPEGGSSADHDILLT